VASNSHLNQKAIKQRLEISQPILLIGQIYHQNKGRNLITQLGDQQHQIQTKKSTNPTQTIVCQQELDHQEVVVEVEAVEDYLPHCHLPLPL
jgi:hypothetical protein